MPHYIRNEDETLPPIDRFNLGQKYFFWVMLYGAIVLLFSGAVLWFPEVIPRNWRGLRYGAVLLHAASALVTTGAFIIHVYMGTAVVRGGFSAMVQGEVMHRAIQPPPRIADFVKLCVQAHECFLDRVLRCAQLAREPQGISQ